MLQNIFTKMNQRQRPIFFIAVAMIGIAALDRLVLGPVLFQMKILDENIHSQKEAFKRDKRILSFHKRIHDEYLRYGSYLDSSEKSQEEIVASLLNKIESSAAQQAVTIKNIRPGDMEDKILYQVYKTGIDCEGNLKDVLSFMKVLEESDYLFQIVRYELAPKSKGAQVIKANMDISRTLIYAEKLPEVSGVEEEEEEVDSSGLPPLPEPPLPSKPLPKVAP